MSTDTHASLNPPKLPLLPTPDMERIAKLRKALMELIERVLVGSNLQQAAADAQRVLDEDAKPILDAIKAQADRECLVEQEMGSNRPKLQRPQ